MTLPEAPPGGGNVPGVDGPVKLPSLAGLADHDDGEPFHFLADLLGFLAVFQVGGFKLGALFLEMAFVGFGGAHRLFLRQKVIAGIPRFHLHR